MSTTILTDALNGDFDGFRFRDMRWWVWCEDCDEAADSVITAGGCNYYCYGCRTGFVIFGDDWPDYDSEDEDWC